MSGVNRIILVGRLGADPELSFLPAGTAVCKLSIATSRKRKDQSGQVQEETQWHRITVFGKSAEACGEYLSKGKQAYVEGRIEYNSWNDKDGNKRNSTEIIANDVQFLSGKNDNAKSDDVGF